MRITAGKITRPQKGVIYGCEGVGKSTFASKFPNPLFMDLEEGTAHLDVKRADVSSWEDILATIDELAKDTQGFGTFVMDTADWAERMCSAYLCKKYKKTGIEDFGYGKGYQYLAEEYAGLLAKLTTLQNAGMHVVVLAHSAIRKLELPEENGSYDHYELKCSKTVSPLIKEWADGLLFANYRTYVQANANGKGKAIGGKERVLYTEHTPFCDAKNRWGLTGILPLSFESVESVFGSSKVPNTPKVSKEPNVDGREDQAWGNVGITDTRKADITLLETSMEFSALSPDELNVYLRGKNPKGKPFITESQTYKDLAPAVLAKIAKEENWEKVETYISERRGK